MPSREDDWETVMTLDEENEKLKAKVIELEANVKRLNTLATDRMYMMQAYKNMLGPKALAVVNAWEAKGVRRVHYDWGPEAFAEGKTGEDRAQWIAEVEIAVANAEPVDRIDG